MSVTNTIFGGQCAMLLLIWTVLIRRRIYRTLPLFSCYVTYSILVTALQWACVSRPLLYFKVFWITEAGDLVLAVGATCESFISTFRGFFVLRWFRWLLPGVALLVACYAIWKAWIHPPVLNSPLAALVIGAEIGLRYFIAGTFLAYVGVRRYMSIRDLRLQSNVMLGFFVASAGMLLAATLRSETGTTFRLFIQWSAPVAYSIALFVWLLSLVTPLAGENQKTEPQVNAAYAVQELGNYSSSLKARR